MTNVEQDNFLLFFLQIGVVVTIATSELTHLSFIVQM